MKIIEKHGLLGIDKAELDLLLAKKNFIGLNRAPRPEKVIVSLTSYKPRIDDIKYTIYSLLNQNFPPDELILWLDEDSFPQREENLPLDLLILKNFGLTIDWCENLRSYKKLIPALKKFPDNIIVTADDDIFYQSDWLKILYETHLKNPDCVIAHRAHRIRLDKQGNLFPYRQWRFEINSVNSSPHISSYRNFFTGAGGVLYSSKFFHVDILKSDIFKELAPTNDDIWFWAMSVLNGTKIKIPADAQSQLIYIDIDMQLKGETLWAKNKTQNDIQIQQSIEKYPELLEALIREDAENTPYLSVVALIEDADKLDDCINNFFAQKFSDFELIIINIGSRVETPTLPTNFRIINYPGGKKSDALKLGLRKSASEYVLFKNADSVFEPNALEVIARLANDSAADVIHFSGHISNGKFIFDDTLEFKNNSPIFFDEPRQSRVVLWLWLQGNLNERLDTKIFKREFLTRHEINFEQGSAEFLLRALTLAEKYLLVPQAFCSCKD